MDTSLSNSEKKGNARPAGEKLTEAPPPAYNLLFISFVKGTQDRRLLTLDTAFSTHLLPSMAEGLKNFLDMPEVHECVANCGTPARISSAFWTCVGSISGLCQREN